MTVPYKRLTLTCHTNPAVPPPYSHSYHIVVEENPAYLVISFKLRYTDRDELSEEEIQEEGFSPDDDFTWSGKLGKVWKQQLDALLKATRFHQNPSQGGDYAIEVRTEADGSGESKGFIAKKETYGWIYFIQELKQAILESESIEAPLTIEYLQIEGQNQTGVVLNGSFADRTFTVRVGNKPVEQLDWDVLRKTISLIFNETEIDPEEALPGRPSGEGYYLMLPGTGWLPFESGIRARYDDDVSVLEDIVKTMNGFIRNA